MRPRRVVSARFARRSRAVTTQLGTRDADYRTMPDDPGDETGEPPLSHRLLRFVEVDSGALLVDDPAYVLPRTKHGRNDVNEAVIYADDSQLATPLAGQPVHSNSTRSGPPVPSARPMTSCLTVDEDEAWALSDRCPVANEFEIGGV